MRNQSWADEHQAAGLIRNSIFSTLLSINDQSAPRASPQAFPQRAGAREWGCGAAVSFIGVWVVWGDQLSAAWAPPPLPPAPQGDGSQPCGLRQSLLQLHGQAASISFPCRPELLLSHLLLHSFINHPGLLNKSRLSFRALVSK